MEHLTLKKLTTDDLAALQRLGKQTYFETFDGTCSEQDMQDYLASSFSNEQLHTELSHPDMHFYAVQQAGELVAYMKLNVGKAQTELQDPQAVEIQRIYVLSQYHGKRIGQFLYEQALVFAQQQNAAYIWLGVWEHNHKAQQFYRKNGFIEFDQHTFWVGSDPQIDIMMKKTL